MDTHAPANTPEGQDDRAPSAPPPDPLIGRVLDGRYKVEAVLGEGGMGLVYRAKHAVLNKPLAIKVLRAEVSKDAEVMSRFQQEAQSASAIGNHHIIEISDFGTRPVSPIEPSTTMIIGAIARIGMVCEAMIHGIRLRLSAFT